MGLQFEYLPPPLEVYSFLLGLTSLLNSRVSKIKLPLLSPVSNSKAPHSIEWTSPTSFENPTEIDCCRDESDGSEA